MGERADADCRIDSNTRAATSSTENGALGATKADGDATKPASDADDRPDGAVETKVDGLEVEIDPDDVIVIFNIRS